MAPFDDRMLICLEIDLFWNSNVWFWDAQCKLGIRIPGNPLKDNSNPKLVCVENLNGTCHMTRPTSI
jgi:hypothetical protein